MTDIMTKNEAEAAAAVLRRAAELLDGGKRWTRKVNARNADGLEVGFHSDGAVCFCLNGGIMRSTLDLFRVDKDARYKAESAAFACVDDELAAMGYGACFMTEWNDDQREYLPVGKVLEGAIARAEQIIGAETEDRAP